MTNFMKNRIYVYVAAVAYILVLFLIILRNGDAGDLRTIRLTEGFALAAASSLFAALTVGPLYKVFPRLPGKSSLLSLRGGFGDAALAFGIAHGSFAFWGLLGGLTGWVFLGGVYKVATLLSLTALVVMGILFVISLGSLPQKVLSRFSWLGKFGYIAGALIFAHVVLVGSHFRSTDSTYFILGGLWSALLIYLLARQVDNFFATRWSRPGFMVVTCIALIVMGAYVGKWYLVADSNSGGAMGHMNMPGMSMAPGTGAQYTLSVEIPPNPTANTAIPLSFRVFTANTGSLVTQFDLVHDKLAHLVIANDKLNYYSHIHPDFANGQFTVQATLPADDNYRAYISFEPKGDAEQVFAYTFQVGKGANGVPEKIVDAETPKAIGSITASLIGNTKVSATDIASGKAKVVFHFTDSGGKPVTNLYPYLAAFGHLVMINADTYSYLHVHPLVVPFGPEETGGPDVEFMVMGSVKPGIYKLFGQFNPNKQLITVPFTLEVTK